MDNLVMALISLRHGPLKLQFSRSSFYLQKSLALLTLSQKSSQNLSSIQKSAEIGFLVGSSLDDTLPPKRRHHHYHRLLRFPHGTLTTCEKKRKCIFFLIVSKLQVIFLRTF